MNIQQRLNKIFKDRSQIKRIINEIELIKDNKDRLDYQVRYITRQNINFTIIIQMNRQKQIKLLKNINKIQYKIILNNNYPQQPPSIIILNSNLIQIGLNPFYNYLSSIVQNWNIKITLLDIIKIVPHFFINLTNKSIKAKPALGQYFEAQRLFIFSKCRTFPVRLYQNGQGYDGMISLVDKQQLVILNQSNFTTSYITSQFIKINQVYSIQKHKNKHFRVLLEIKRSKKFALEFSSDQYENIVQCIVQAIKISQQNKVNHQNNSSESSDDENQIQHQHNNQQIQINNSDLQSQILILQSLVQSNPNTQAIKSLVALLQKAVQYYSINNQPRSQLHLKNLQSIMNNELMQILLVSQQSKPNLIKKKQYESIANYL